ncbi:SIS domain-containing protein [Streptomyces sp. NPDC048751]|uniref:D-sedoheptulose-7-phosphate isomerase n=1 Tax=Streptomyces sp. NPDC048751 TaxID=3365591 RepID=UPI00372146FB
MNTSSIPFLRDRAATATRALEEKEIVHAATVLDEVRRTQGIVIAAGNGGSSSTATHFAADLVKFTRKPDAPHFRALSLTDNIACHTAWTNDDDPRLALARLAEPWLPSGPGRRDAAVLFSVHGGSRSGTVSNNLVELAHYVQGRGGDVIAITGFDGGALGDLADVHINLPVSDEPIATPAVESIHLLIAHALCLALSDLEVE